jgi:hypothetical protein
MNHIQSESFGQFLFQFLKTKTDVPDNITYDFVSPRHLGNQAGNLPAADFGFSGLAQVLGSILIVPIQKSIKFQRSGPGIFQFQVL